MHLRSQFLPRTLQRRRPFRVAISRAAASVLQGVTALSEVLPLQACKTTIRGGEFVSGETKIIQKMTSMQFLMRQTTNLS